MANEKFKLTSEQEKQLVEYRDEWLQSGLCTDPADRPRAEQAAAGLREMAGLKPAPAVWFDGPCSAQTFVWLSQKNTPLTRFLASRLLLEHSSAGFGSVWEADDSNAFRKVAGSRGRARDRMRLKMQVSFDEDDWNCSQFLIEDIWPYVHPIFQLVRVDLSANDILLARLKSQQLVEARSNYAPPPFYSELGSVLHQIRNIGEDDLGRSKKGIKFLFDKDFILTVGGSRSAIVQTRPEHCDSFRYSTFRKYMPDGFEALSLRYGRVLSSLMFHLYNGGMSDSAWDALNKTHRSLIRPVDYVDLLTGYEVTLEPYSPGDRVLMHRLSRVLSPLLLITQRQLSRPVGAALIDAIDSPVFTGYRNHLTGVYQKVANVLRPAKEVEVLQLAVLKFLDKTFDRGLKPLAIGKALADELSSQNAGLPSMWSKDLSWRQVMEEGFASVTTLTYTFLELVPDLLLSSMLSELSNDILSRRLTYRTIKVDERCRQRPFCEYFDPLLPFFGVRSLIERVFMPETWNSALSKVQHKIPKSETSGSLDWLVRRSDTYQAALASILRVTNPLWSFARLWTGYAAFSHKPEASVFHKLAEDPEVGTAIEYALFCGSSPPKGVCYYEEGEEHNTSLLAWAEGWKSRYQAEVKALMRERPSLSAMFWTQFDCYWLAYYSFPNKYVEKIYPDEDCKRLGYWEDLSKSCTGWMPYEGIDIFVERPKSISLEEEVLHNDSGPVIHWRDGWKNWALGGVSVDEQIVMRPETQTIAQINDEENAEVQRLRIERYGWLRYLEEMNAQIVDFRRDDVSATYESLMAAGEMKILVGNCPSTARVYAMEVDGAIETCEDAQKWLHNLNGINCIGAS